MSRTSSIRLSDDLYRRLDRFAHERKQGKNGVIARALEEYLDRHHRAALAREAARQSEAVSRVSEGEEEWLNLADQAGWK